MNIPYTLGEIRRKLNSFIPEKSDQELYFSEKKEINSEEDDQDVSTEDLEK